MQSSAEPVAIKNEGRLLLLLLFDSFPPSSSSSSFEAALFQSTLKMVLEWAPEIVQMFFQIKGLSEGTVIPILFFGLYRFQILTVRSSLAEAFV